MNVIDILDELSRKAQNDMELKNRLLATKESSNSVSEFCSIARELGYELYDMDLIDAGEEFHAAMKRSTNGGGENSPKLTGQDDYYEMFIAELKNVGIRGVLSWSGVRIFLLQLMVYSFLKALIEK